ncbi:FliM/FliN family flagellar motor C-terminal domain-containing protein [Alteraurantiacibacter aquimixticola]|uniref:Flagellar motor switch protein FliM n=1 Tax=Alteraurantiacibacter aquimixticola TaxID=2489173 RepID=A0A4T3F2P8_9SPHN|nr:flagellar motor switch protein FliM [Alteraurantiacibacter aquimixticola]TIX51535.1 flagellar motor switch protein FliM [Alteraurantiacibacter aquimixticola]
MKSEGVLVAERALAQHSEALAGRAPEPAELAKDLGEMSGRLCQSLEEELERLLGGERPTVSCPKVDKANAAKLHKLVNTVAVNFLLADGQGGQVLASLNFPAALTLTDQVFGGSGTVTGAIPERLPSSCDLALVRLGKALGDALGQAFGREAPFALAAESRVLAKLVSTKDEEPLLMLACDVAREGCANWELMLTIRQSDAACLLSDEARKPRAAKGSGKANAGAAPFAAIPLPLTAQLARIEVPVAKISTLKPGDTLPLTLAASVPLRLGDTEIARGQVGASDGALALRITSMAWEKKGTSNDG